MTFTTTNFTALEIRQGYRKDNTYFGVCSNCGDHIHKSRFGNAWLHTIPTGEHSSRLSEYCPAPYESQEQASRLDIPPKMCAPRHARDVNFDQIHRKN